MKKFGIDFHASAALVGTAIAWVVSHYNAIASGVVVTATAGYMIYKFLRERLKYKKESNEK